ncbi:gaLECtin [Caenorhabditis elegans]|uniref:GaLECtin n=1 Tax=Caenorhabditis elegans TaxID=6239 RepID=Q8I4A3_CAEEL|nr:gaLECtin [Caenorhabditis elegans]CAD57722.1 gaLECtin [Caenorhabditis elegans]|eukprot:NP_001022534.1 gaLECtin [Caenorhabditis elegans]
MSPRGSTLISTRILQISPATTCLFIFPSVSTRERSYSKSGSEKKR